MLAVAIVALLIIVVLALRLSGQRKRAGLKGWVMTQDLDGKSDRIYRDQRTGITCKPDVVERDRLIEYKSAMPNNKARESDVLQVAAQMMATGVQEAEIRYGNNKRFFFQKDSPAMQAAKAQVSQIIGTMRWHLRKGLPPKGRPSPKKCYQCRFKIDCPDVGVKSTATMH